MSLSSDIAEEFSLTSIEASEIEQKSLVLASALISLRSSYSIDHLTESEEYAIKNKEISQRGGYFEILEKLMNRLSDDAKDMWKRYKTCEDAQQDFEAVCRIHSVNCSDDEALTKSLELAYKHERLSNAEAVAEGRRLYESIGRTKSQSHASEFFKF